MYEDHLVSYNEESDDYQVDESKLVGVVDEYGSFSEIMDILKAYVHTMVEIHELKL